jgi:hypothetical protein
MKRSTFITAGGLIMVAACVWIFTTHGPPSGLPTAADYYATGWLPDIDGAVSWNTLASVKFVKENAKVVPKFNAAILNLDNKIVHVFGFVIPLDVGEKQKHFLLSAQPPHCPFCLPAGPGSLIEVLSTKAVEYDFEPVMIAGKLELLIDAPDGMLYRLTEAASVTSSVKR